MTDQEKVERYDEIQSWYWWLERRTHDGKAQKDTVRRFLRGIEEYLDKYEDVEGKV